MWSAPRSFKFSSLSFFFSSTHNKWYCESNTIVSEMPPTSHHLAQIYWQISSSNTCYHDGPKHIVLNLLCSPEAICPQKTRFEGLPPDFKKELPQKRRFGVFQKKIKYKITQNKGIRGIRGQYCLGSFLDRTEQKVSWRLLFEIWISAADFCWCTIWCSACSFLWSISCDGGKSSSIESCYWSYLLTWFGLTGIWTAWGNCFWLKTRVFMISEST